MKLNQVTIPSKNLAKAIELYTKLGLRLIVDDSPNYVRFELPDGDSTFSIHKVDSLTKSNGTSIYFEDENLEVLVEKLLKKGIKFTQLPKNQTWLWQEAHLLDPDGNNLILFKAGENRKNPPWRITT